MQLPLFARRISMSTVLKMLAASALLAGCHGSTRTEVVYTTQQAPDLMASANATLDNMIARDPGLRELLNMSAGYAVFPEVGKGALVVGGASGRGVLYQRGAPIGY